MSQIVHQVIQRLVDSLTTTMIDEVSSSDPSRASVVKAYRFQQDPIESNVYLYVSGGNPDDPNTMDGRIGMRSMDDLGINIPSGEIGGGHLWWRKGRVRLGCFFVTGEIDQESAGDYAHTVLGRAMECIESTRVSDLVDEFGEQALKVYVFASNFYESGGPDNQYIWRGDIHWQVLTERPL